MEMNASMETVFEGGTPQNRESEHPTWLSRAMWYSKLSTRTRGLPIWIDEEKVNRRIGTAAKAQLDELVSPDPM
jgi:hypothetical protein